MKMEGTQNENGNRYSHALALTDADRHDVTWCMCFPVSHRLIGPATSRVKCKRKAKENSGQESTTRNDRLRTLKDLSGREKNGRRLRRLHEARLTSRNPTEGRKIDERRERRKKLTKEKSQDKEKSEIRNKLHRPRLTSQNPMDGRAIAREEAKGESMQRQRRTNELTEKIDSEKSQKGNLEGKCPLPAPLAFLCEIWENGGLTVGHWPIWEWDRGHPMRDSQR